MKLLGQKEFWFGVAAAVVVLKFGDKLPVVGPYVSKLKV
jgi:hypothetical protein